MSFDTGIDFSSIKNDDEFDEFDTGIDFSAIEIPSHSAVSSAKNKSRHFG
jgi:hypothetical protein